MSMDVEPMRTIDPRETAAAVDGRRSAMEDPRETLTAVDGRRSAGERPQGEFDGCGCQKERRPYF